MGYTMKAFVWASLCLVVVDAGLFGNFFQQKESDTVVIPTPEESLDLDDDNLVGLEALNDFSALTLSNGAKMPVVGLEADHMKASDVVNALVAGAEGIRLFDTSHVAGNENIVAQGIVQGAKEIKASTNLNGPIEVHVVTKVWYTHLGYNRTKHALQEAFDAFSVALDDPNVDLKIHAMLHWPRCYQEIDWMHCENEEAELVSSVKEMGPAPHLNKHEAWRGSWKALEDIYSSNDQYPRLSSIGVANFMNGDMLALMESSRVQPHIVHMNVWSLLHDPYTVNLCYKHGAHIQVLDMMDRLVVPGKRMPKAGSHMQKVAYEISSGTSAPVTISQVVAKWLTQFEISVLQKDPTFSITKVPDLSEDHQSEIGNVIEAILSEDDLEEDAYVKVSFHAQDQDMVLFYYPGPTDEDEVMITYIRKGASYEESTHPDHPFRLYSAVDPYVYYDYNVDAKYGEKQDVYVSLE